MVASSTVTSNVSESSRSERFAIRRRYDDRLGEQSIVLLVLGRNPDSHSSPTLAPSSKGVTLVAT